MIPKWLNAPLAEPSIKHRKEAIARQGELTKPPGSLGVLERIAIDFAGWQGRVIPELKRLKIVVFAGDHGVVASGVSAFPQSVTVEMVKNFSRGGAAITVLAKHLNANFEVVNVGTVTDPGPLPGVVSSRVGAGTADMSIGAAMDEKELALALTVGRDAALRGRDDGAQLLIGGEMGIGNTTAAAAVGAVFTSLSPEMMAGPGTGLDSAGVGKKRLLFKKLLMLTALTQQILYLFCPRLAGLSWRLWLAFISPQPKRVSLFWLMDLLLLVLLWLLSGCDLS